MENYEELVKKIKDDEKTLDKLKVALENINVAINMVKSRKTKCTDDGRVVTVETTFV